MPRSYENALQRGSSFQLMLECERCPDGVQLHDFQPTQKNNASFLGSVELTGPHFRYRTPRRGPVSEVLSTIEELVALRFVNARTIEAQIGFFSRFGMLISDHELALEDAHQRQMHVLNLLERLLGRSPKRKPQRLIEELNSLLGHISLQPQATVLEDGHIRLSLRPKSLWAYMYLEIMVAASHGVKLHFCDYCADAFLTGSLTGRRGHAKFCSDRCRVANYRKKQKAKT